MLCRSVYVRDVRAAGGGGGGGGGGKGGAGEGETSRGEPITCPEGHSEV